MTQTLIAAAAAVGAAVVGGTYAAFSMMVMPALATEPASSAARTMSRINAVAERGPFILAFGGAALAAVALAVTSARSATSEPVPLVAAALSLSSTAITVAANVPLNRRLDREGAAFWDAYRRRWTAWNTVRAGVALAAVALLAGSSH